MRLPLLLSLLVVPGLACSLEEREERPATSDKGAARKPAAATKPPESTDMDAGLETSIQAVLALALQPGPHDVLPFGAGMTRPERIQGELPGYTPEALAARVEGAYILRCIILVTGEATACRLIRPMLHMDTAIMNAAKTWRFKPATYKGQPVSVDYTFTVEMKLPKENR